MIAPVFQIVNIGTQLTEAVAGLDRTREIMAELEENQDPGRTVKMPPIEGRVRFENVEFAYTPEKPVLHGISFNAEPGTVTALVGSSGSGKSTIISLVCAFHTPSQRPGAGRRHRSRHRRPEYLPLATRRRAAGFVPLRRHHPRKHYVLAPRRHRGAVPLLPAAPPASTSLPSAFLKATTPSSASAA